MTNDGMLASLSLDDRFVQGRVEGDEDLSNVREMSLEEAEGMVAKWGDSGEEMVWEKSTESQAYLAAVDKLLSCGLSSKLLNLAAGRLHKEFQQLLRVHSECVDPSWLPDSFSAPSFGSAAEAELDEDGNAQSSREQSCVIDLLPPSVVADLSDISRRMIDLGRADECVEVYVKVRKGILEDSMQILGVERVGVEELHRIQWEVLEPRLKRWIKGMKASIRVLFASERFLCDDVFLDQVEVSDNCFAQVANEAALQLLRLFAEVAVAPESPERMFKLLDVYETLQELLPELESTFLGEPCLEVPIEAARVLLLVKDAVKGTFTSLKNGIEHDSSRSAAPGGALHPLTRYVMNYLGFLSEYLPTLKEISGAAAAVVPAATEAGSDASSGSLGGEGDAEAGGSGSGSHSVLQVKIHEVLDALVQKLEEHSRLYRDPALGIIFLMNNIRYIVQKVKASEQSVVSDDWVRRHSSMVRYHAINYQRTAWGKIFSFLRDEGIRTGYSNVSTEVLKDRFRSFNAAVEEIHRTQSTWVVPEVMLREELRVQIGDKLLPAYRSFLGRYRSNLERVKHAERYLKYSDDDLEALLNDLFEGASGSMSRRRSISAS